MKNHKKLLGQKQLELYDEDACSEVSSNWESDGSALFEDVDEGETYQQ